MIPIQFKVDIFAELNRLLEKRFEPTILLPVYNELKKMVAEDATKGRQAAFSMKQVERCHLVRVEKKPFESVDDLILRYAKDYSCIVATNDSNLRRRLRKARVPAIYLREKTHLQLEGYTP